VSDDEADLTLLVELNDQVELAAIRSLLDGHDVAYVVQGEHHAAMVGSLLGNPVIVPRILVSNRDFEHAKALLDANPVIEPDNLTGAPLPEGALCPVHEKPALAACSRCGTFLCTDCKALGQPPLCEQCTAKEEKKLEPQREKGRTMRKVVAYAMLAPFAIMLLGALSAILQRCAR
jgi:hypothetical protein